MMSEKERREIDAGGGADGEYGLNRRLERGLVTEMFEWQVEQREDAVAVSFEGESVSYGELNVRANQLGRLLRRLGVDREVRVGVLMERSIESIVALLGIIKAGGAYVPFDPEYPPDRLNWMIEDSGVGVTITQLHLCERLKTGGRTRVLAYETLGEELAGLSTTNLQVELDGANLIYVIYTSGSTGRPKGALVEHAHITRLHASIDRIFRFGADDAWTLFHSYAFDFSVWEMWGALLFGARLVIVSNRARRSPEEFYQLLNEQGVTVLGQTPSVFRQ